MPEDEVIEICDREGCEQEAIWKLRDAQYCVDHVRDLVSKGLTVKLALGGD